VDVRKVLFIEGIVNLVVMLSKLSVGLLTNSTAIIADAIHSLSDLANNVIAWFTVKLSESPADDNHHYGHKKFEQIAVFVLASLLTIVAFEILTQAFGRFGQVVEQSQIGLTVLIAAMIVNICLTLWQRHWAHRLHSQILHADTSHTFSDVLTSFVVIVGWQLSALGYYWLDTIFAIVIAFMIFFLAFKLFQRAIPILVDYNDIQSTQLFNAIKKIEGVRNVVRVRVRRSNETRLADIIVAVDPDITVSQSDLIVQQIQKSLLEEFAIKDITVSCTPDTDAA
jgi:cation diffusion facilitator family transporter